MRQDPPASNDFSHIEEALRRLADAPCPDIVPRVMERVREMDRVDIETTEAALRAIPPYAGRDIVPDVMAAIRARENRLLRLRRWGLGAVAACAVAALGIGTALRAPNPGRDVSLPAETTVADVDLSSPEAAAAWLRQAQRPDGSWDSAALGNRPEHWPALSALGLLALHRQDPVGNRDAVLRGAEALCARQEQDGGFGRGSAARLNHGLVTAVLLEVNQTLHSERVGESLAGALAFARRTAAMGDGSWGYSPSSQRDGGSLFAKTFPSRGAEFAKSTLDEGLDALPDCSPEEDENLFYRSCLAALDLRR